MLIRIGQVSNFSNWPLSAAVSSDVIKPIRRCHPYAPDQEGRDRPARSFLDRSRGLSERDNGGQ
jgi:hypothetical protein